MTMAATKSCGSPRGTDSQAVLTELARRTRIERFELARPSLRDIFVRIARPEPADAKGANHA